MALVPEGGFIAVDGAVVPTAEFRTTPGGLVAPVVFDGARIYEDASGALIGFRLEDHWRRLQDSAKLVRFEVPDMSGATDMVGQLLRANGVEHEAQVLVVLQAGDGTTDPYPTTGTSLTMMVTEGGRVTEADGWHLRVSSWRKGGDLAIPARTKFAAGYHSARLADLDAWGDGYDGAIFLTAQGTVAEGSGYNLFMVRGDTLITPPVTDEILEGITRDTLLRVVPELVGLPVLERSIDRSELYLAQEVFVCGTSLEVTPVLSVDRRPVGDGRPGERSLAIRDAYFRLVKGELPAYERWLTRFQQ